MPEYRRITLAGGLYFFTAVTFHRRPILTTPAGRKLLHDAWAEVRERHPFDTLAVCILPDHLHCVWSLPDGDANYSMRWKEIKRLFTKGYLASVGPGEIRNASREEHGEAALWQRRFWEHWIRDDADLNRHIEYIHYNPVKHGLVERAEDWPWSSVHRYVKMGWIKPEGQDEVCGADFGE